MKVSDLKKGMILCVPDTERIAWLSEENLLPSGEPELRFAPKIMESLVPGRVLKEREFIVYLGHDKEPVNSKDPNYKALVRRVMVKEKTAVVLGYNFKHLEPRPEFSE